MTGGVGKEELTRFYKHHFTSESVSYMSISEAIFVTSPLQVTPPDTEIITVSRTSTSTVVRYVVH